MYRFNSENRRSLLATTASRGRRTVSLACRFGAIAVCWAGLAGTAHATGTINVNSTLQRSAATSGLCSLGAAIITANTNTSTDGCAISGTATAPYTINVPAGTYTLDHVDNNGSFGEPFGLPGIQSDITIAGTGAATTIIERSSSDGTPLFGLFDNRQNTGHLTLNDLTLRHGSQASSGAAVANNGGPTSGGPDALTVNRCVFDGNSAITSGNGGAIAGGGTINDSTFSNNTAAGQGGAISGVTIVSNSLFTGNQAGTGGGALFCVGGECSIPINDSTFDSNSTATGQGGAVWATATTIARDYFVNNSAADVNSSGGALFSSGGSITDSFFFDNAVNGSNGAGGGAVVGTNLTITGTTFRRNQASGSGGALQASSSTIVNSTFVFNSANADGGAIFSTGSLILNNVTIFGNSSDSNGGGIAGDGDIVFNSIIAVNHNGTASPTPDCSGSLTSTGHNIISVGVGSCSVIATSGDQFGTVSAPIDPVVGVPAPNGGKKAGRGGAVDIPTLALLVGSPALDAGDPSPPGLPGAAACATTDQRGITRPVGSACDIGAFEAKQGGETSNYDLSVTNTASTSTAIVGDNVTFTIAVTNPGPDTATGVSVSDEIGTASFVSFNAPLGWNCNVGSAVTCTRASLQIQGTSTISVVLKMSAINLGGFYSNKATVTSTGNDTDVTNNSSSVNVGIQDPPTDLSLTMTGSSSSVTVGSNVTYTMTVKNNGPANTEIVRVIDTQPANTTLVSMTSSQGTCNILSPGQLRCTLGSLANGATATATIVLAPQAGAVPSITNSAQVVATESDPNPANDTASVTTTVNQAVSSDFNFSISPPSATVSQGGTLNYPITITASGGFSGSVSITCSGVPGATTCGSSPSPVVVNGNTVQATLVLVTTAPTKQSGVAWPSVGTWSFPGGLLLATSVLAALTIATRRNIPRRARAVYGASLGVALILLCVGCGGNTLVGGTPKGTYNITVTATSGQTSHSSQITVVVGP